MLQEINKVINILPSVKKIVLSEVDFGQLKSDILGNTVACPAQEFVIRGVTVTQAIE